MKTTLKELLHSINVIGNDFDITVDGIDSIAVCPPVELTPEGMAKFEKALNVECDGFDVGGNCSEEECNDAWMLLVSLSGYCSSENYDKWFTGDMAKEI